MVEITEYDYAVNKTMNLIVDNLLDNYDIYTNIDQDDKLHETTRIKRFVEAFVDTSSPIETLMCFGLFRALDACFGINEENWVIGVPRATEPIHKPMWIFEEDKIPDCFMNFSLKNIKARKQNILKC